MCPARICLQIQQGHPNRPGNDPTRGISVRFGALQNLEFICNIYVVMVLLAFTSTCVAKRPKSTRTSVCIEVLSSLSSVHVSLAISSPQRLGNSPELKIFSLPKPSVPFGPANVETESRLPLCSCKCPTDQALNLQRMRQLRDAESHPALEDNPMLVLCIYSTSQ